MTSSLSSGTKVQPTAEATLTAALSPVYTEINQGQAIGIAVGATLGGLGLALTGLATFLHIKRLKRKYALDRDNSANPWAAYETAPLEHYQKDSNLGLVHEVSAHEPVYELGGH